MANEPTLNRVDVVSRILSARGDSLLVTGLGSTCWDAAAAGDVDTNFYLWGGMGGAAMVGLGLAIAQPTRRVLVITGDGELLMGLGALATIAVQKPSNLTIVCIDNERYGETGMQPTHTAAGVNLIGIAESAGFPRSLGVTDDASLAAAVPLIYDARGPVFVSVKVLPTHGRPAMPARHGPYLKDRFRRALLGEREANA